MSFNFNIAEFFKLPLKIFAAIALGTGLILFLPESISEKLYLIELRESFGFVIGLIFVISVSIVGISLIICLVKLISDRVLYAKSKRISEQYINNLNDYQKSIVCFLYDEPSHTGGLPWNDGAVRLLEQNFLIIHVGNHHLTSSFNPDFPYMLQPWAVDYLSKHIELLEEFRIAKVHFEETLKRDDDFGDYW